MIRTMLIAHCETEPVWELYPWKIRIKAFFGILSEYECKEYGIKKIKHKSEKE